MQNLVYLQQALAKIKTGAKEQIGGFLSMLFGTFEASLLVNLLTGNILTWLDNKWILLYFCIKSINFMLKGKSLPNHTNLLLNYTNLFSPEIMTRSIK